MNNQELINFYAAVANAQDENFGKNIGGMLGKGVLGGAAGAGLGMLFNKLVPINSEYASLIPLIAGGVGGIGGMVSGNIDAQERYKKAMLSRGYDLEQLSQELSQRM